MEHTLTLAPQPKPLRLSRTTLQLLCVISGTAVSFGLACLLHFLWEWSGQLLPVAVVASVNESVWEHVKILCWPFLFWSFAEYYILRPDARRLLTAR